MKRLIFTILCLALVPFLAACSRKVDADLGAPPPAQVEQEQDSGIFKVAHPEQFPLAIAGEHKAAPELTVTGVVNPDIARSVPAISLASGRAIEVKARLGDTVKKGQLLMRVKSNDIASAYATYRNAVCSEELSKLQAERARLLFAKGAIAKKDLEIAEETEESTLVVLDAAIQALRILGVTDLKNHPNGIVDVYAPISGVIVEQNVTAGAGVKTLDNSPNLFTIANLDDVWILCDVYENNLALCPPRRLRGRPPERLSRQGVQGPDQQHRPHPRPHHPHREGKARNEEPRAHAHRHVCHRHVLRP